jgi:excinuclease ABC subunit C
MAFDLDQLKCFSEHPGVYLMKDLEQRVIYIGKAKNLNKRLKQYFLKGGDKRAIIPLLQKEVEEIETLVVGSEVEALLLESSLIKKYKPKFNAIFRDDKSYCKLKVSTENEWPRLYSLRKKSFAKEKGKFFGPFVSSFAAKQTLEIINKLFPLRECSDQELLARDRPCILFEMGRCLAPCVNKCTKEEYNSWVQKSIKVLLGDDNSLLNELKKSMVISSENLEFEKAGQYLELIQQVEKTVAKQHVDVDLNQDIHALALIRDKEEVTLSLLPFLHGKMQRVENFFIKSFQSDSEILSSFITQYYQENFVVPEEIILSQDIDSKALLEGYFFGKFNKKCNVIFPKKGKKKHVIDLALSNAKEARSSKDKKEKLKQMTLLELKDKLELKNFPETILCFDISHLSQSYPVASMVVFKNGEAEKKSYRKYKIDPAVAGDDCRSMHEVLLRAFSKKLNEEADLPHLVVVDGGKGQLKEAIKVLKNLNIKGVDLISLVKEKGRHDKGMSLEKVYVGEELTSVSFSKKERTLLFLQRVRDEAHRFAIEFQRKRMQKETIKSSLWEIPGIGKAKATSLLQHFGSIKNILKAKPEEILSLKGISKKDLSNVLAFIQQEL